MGAGDIYKYGQEFVDMLEERKKQDTD